MTTIMGLTVASGGIYVVLGFLHLVYTLLDIRRPRRFAPANDAVRTAMQGTTIRLTKGRTSMWDGWLGFNISHSYGALIFGGLVIGVGLYQGGVLATTGMLSLLVGISVAYLLVGLRFWFYIPNTGIALGTLGLAIAAMLKYSA